MRDSNLELTLWDIEYLYNKFKNEGVTQEDLGIETLTVFKDSDGKLITQKASVEDILETIEDFTGITLEEFNKNKRNKRSFILDDNTGFYDIVEWLYFNGLIRKEKFEELLEAYDGLEDFEGYLHSKASAEEYEFDYHVYEEENKPKHVMILEDMCHPRWKSSLVNYWHIVSWCNPTLIDGLKDNKRKVVEICQDLLTLRRFELSFDTLLHDLNVNLNAKKRRDKNNSDLSGLLSTLENIFAGVKLKEDSEGMDAEEFKKFLNDTAKEIFKTRMETKDKKEEDIGDLIKKIFG